MKSNKGTSIKKVQSLRNNEYYDQQVVFDDLYAKSKENVEFNSLMDIITNEQNIALAFRNIKNNTGSKTKGTDNLTIKEIADSSYDDYVIRMKNRLKDYKPHEVRRVFIPKSNGKMRPLGIPTIEDRLLQQCIKQVLEPIAEAKFHDRSYGFRPNRSTHHAIAKFLQMVNMNKLHYVVDVDIEGFFDNVNHGKLLKQLWTMGIRDKALICIISKMLKAPIEGEGIPEKGTPQGGILSPLLSNIVLNELDWWIDSQWENMKTRHNYVMQRANQKCKDKSNQHRALRKNSNLKEIYIIRYADDFKILCRDRKDAEKIFIAVKLWLKERLGLEISKEKSKITNLRKSSTEFLGFKFTAKPKRNTFVVQSRMTDKARENATEKLKDAVKRIQMYPNADVVRNYNSIVLGLQNYYKIATLVSLDFYEIDFEVRRTIYNRLRKKFKYKDESNSKTYDDYYGKCKRRKMFIADTIMFPISYIKHESPLNLPVGICNYTKEGRQMVHQNVKGAKIEVIRYMLENPIQNMSTLYNDNRISLYSGQSGVCKITKQPLEIGNMECHHKKPRSLGGTDEYSNLVFVTHDVHKLIHATTVETIDLYMKKLNLSEKELKSLNSYRRKVGNRNITVEQRLL